MGFPPFASRLISSLFPYFLGRVGATPAGTDSRAMGSHILIIPDNDYFRVLVFIRPDIIICAVITPGRHDDLSRQPSTRAEFHVI